MAKPHSDLYKRIMNSAEWRSARLRKLTANPLCERCKEQGHITAAQAVHHITEIESGHTDAECWQLATTWSNLMSVCFQCHHEIHTHSGSQTKQGHINRNNERMARWAARHGATKQPEQ